MKNYLTIVVSIGINLIISTVDAQIKTSEVKVEHTNNVTTITGLLGIGTESPESSLHVTSGNYGLKSQYATAVIEAGDAQLDLISSSAAKWGSSLNLIEGNGASNTNIWSIVRQTTGGSGNTSLNLNYGTSNSHLNPSLFTFTTSKRLGINTESPSAHLHVNAGNYGVNSQYATAIIEDVDAQLDLVSSSDAKWGSSINLIEGNGSSNTNIWSLVRQTTGGSGNSSLNLNYGTSNNHINPSLVTFATNGNVGIGKENPNYKLEVNGAIHGSTFSAASPPSWPDYVFENGYKLRTLEEVEQHISENGHLPEIPSEVEVTENGINLGEMNAKLLQKIEELTLYLIEQNDTNKEQQERIERLEKVNAELLKKLEKE